MGHILLIDDDAGFCDASAYLLRDAGHEVVTAYSGADGLQALRSRTVDLVLADFFLGDLTAIDLLKSFRRASVDVPVIVFTGMGAVQAAVDAMKLGAADYLLKPLDFDEVLSVVNLLLARRVQMVDVHGTPRDHAAVRWAEAVVGLLHSPVDVRSIAEWGRAVGISRGALRNRCAIARLSPRRSLLLARLLRAIFRSDGRPWVPHQVLSVADPRTLGRMLALGGLSTDPEPPTVDRFLKRQVLIADRLALDALAQRCRRTRAPAASMPSSSK
jgi:DNA-binding response OmpR family regulator